MDISKSIQLAYQYYQTGNFHQAKNTCAEILKEQPNNEEIIYLLGIVYVKLEEYVLAMQSLKKSLQFNPNNVYACVVLGAVYQRQGEVDEAITCYKKALQINPNLADVHNNLGSLLREKKQFNEAIVCYQTALKINPDYIHTYINMANIFLEIKQLDEAITCCQKAIQINPNVDEAYAKIGLALTDMGRSDEANSFYRKANQLNPNNRIALYGLCTILQCKGQLDEASQYYHKLLELDPNYAKAHYGLGFTFRDKGQLDEAINCFQKAIKLKPTFIEAHIGLGSAFLKKGQIDEASTSYQNAIELDSDNPIAHHDWAFCLISLGDLSHGWKEHQWVYKTQEGINFLQNYSEPLWTGFDISGLTVLLHDGPLGSFGFGDTIQFIRYAPLIVERGAKVIFECKKELISLLKNVDGVNQIMELGGKPFRFDVHCHLMDLPFIFDISLDNIPANVPYISVNPALIHKWGEKIQQERATLKVGLVWGGGSGKYCNLKTYSLLGSLDKIIFYSLQKGPAADEAKNPPDGMQFIDLTNEIYDFTDTAALIEHLDLVISVDTSVAHLAGALGKPVWTLLPFASCWRWMRNSEDSPWYPTMRLFRQPSPGDWESVIIKVKDELLKLLGKR
jgi:tetratricopeptide (TPR) repeat protein